MESGLPDALRVLSKHRWYVILALVGCVAAAGIATSLMTPTYEASAQLFVGQRQVAVSGVTQGQQVAQLSADLLKSYARILTTRPIADTAIQKGRLPLTSTQLLNKLHADPVLDTQIIQLSFSSINPQLASATVNAVSAAFVSKIETIEIPTQGDSRPAIKVSVVEPAQTPNKPVSPSLPKNLALAIILGSLLGVGLAFVVEQLDTTIKGKRDLHAERPVLVEIPKGPKSQHVAIQDADGPVGEAFRRLRSTIQFIDVDERVHSILVTSAEPGEGKSTVAANLAVAYAQAETNTVLVEADLRNPVLQKILPIEGKPGLADFLTRPIRIEDITLQTRMRRLKVIPVGAMVPNPSELLATDRMRWFIDQLTATYSTVIIDSAPLLPVADTIALCTRVDGVIVVARGGQTKRRPLDESLEAIHAVGGNLLGVVLNAVKPEPGTSGYYPYPYPYVKRRTTA